MNHKRWSIVVVTAQTSGRVRQIHLPAMVLLLITIIGCAGFVGMARLLWYTGTYANAKFGVYEAQRENRSLMMKVKFLDKFVAKENDKIESLIAFEDNIRLQYGMNHISADVRMAGIGGRPTPEETLLSNILDPVLIRAEAVRESVSNLLRKSELQDSTLSQVAGNVKAIHEKWAQRPSIWPAQGRVTSYYGLRFHPIEGRVLFHDGLDIANKSWTPIYSAANGVVKFVGTMDFYGRVINIRHPQSGCETVYGHLSQIVVTSGQAVKRGDLIGYMGSTGRSTGSHLHYEVRTDSRAVNPLSFILPTDAIVD
jgi:murein DD-endopeptidase MepM/ murein hydrolase activator NlpD